MQKVTLLFYNAKAGGWLDRIIAKLDGSPFSHVEIVLGQDENGWYTAGAKAGGRSTDKHFYAKTDAVLPVEIALPDYVAWHSNAQLLLGKRYGYMKLPRTKLAWWWHNDRTEICSTFVARALELREPDQYGVADIWLLAQCHLWADYVRFKGE